MSPGDLVVCGVSADIVVEDIGLNVPKGVAVPVPGDSAQRSKDLWRYISQGLIFQCDVSNIRRSAPFVPAPVESLKYIEAYNSNLARIQGDLARVTTAKSDLEADIGRLQAENARLRVELADERAKTQKLDKLDDILKLLQKQSVAQPPLRSDLGSGSNKGPAVDGAVPMYIPSQIKSEGPSDVVGLVARVGQTEGGSVAVATQALRNARKRDQ
jgi:hypothetical protein